MRKRWMRVISAALVTVMVSGSLPMSALAADEQQQGITADKADEGEKILKLWYDEPAPMGGIATSGSDKGYDRAWENWSLPLGCGYMGVNVFGRTDTERIQITENSLANPYDSNGIASFRQGLNNFSETYIDFKHPEGEVSNYERNLVLNDATAHVKYDYNGVTYSREYFTSYPDKIMAIKLEASQKGALTFTLRPTVPYVKDYNTTVGDGRGKSGKVVADTATNDLITLSGNMAYYDIDFEGQYKVIPTGGTIKAANDEKGENGTITVSGADSAVILIAVGTNYQMESRVFTAKDKEKLAPYPHPHEKVSKYIADAASQTYEELRARHVEDYQTYFKRVDLDLGGQLSDTVTTDAMLAQYKKSGNDRYLEELYFQYGRYLLISSSREGCLPANLQGIWNVYDSAPWSAGYWHNINQQMNYWPAFVTNLPEMFESYADYNEAFREAAQINADNYLREISSGKMAEAGTGENGWAVGTGTWPYKAGGPGVNGHSGPGTGAFTAKLFWDYYDFTRNKTVLEEHTYPAISGMSKFLSKTLIDQDGRLLVSPSASPEQRQGSGYYQTVGCAFDQQMVFENYLDTIKAAKLLGKESEEIVKQAEAEVNLLDPVNVGISGQVKEYREENEYGEIGDKSHRHISQLVGLYPGTSITSDTDAWMDAAKVTLNKRGDKSTGWAMAHRLNLWARTKDGNRAYKLYQTLLKTGTLNNLWDTHPPFQIDGNFGGTAGVAEMLLQSHEGYLAPLSARPDTWSTGSYSGLVGRGNFEVGASWKDGQAEKFTITSKSGGECKVKYYNLANANVKDSTGAEVTFTAKGTDLITFNTKVGETYSITGIPEYKATAAPSGITMTSGKEGTLVKWNPSSDGASYNVYRAVNDASSYELLAEGVKETSYECDLSGLKDQDQAVIKVTAVSASGRESSGITAIQAPVAAPSKAEGFFTENGSLQIMVSAAEADSYSVYQKKQDTYEKILTTKYDTMIVENADQDGDYWITAVSEGRESKKAQIEVTQGAMLKNVLLNKGITVSGRNANASYPLSNALDGNTETRYAVSDAKGTYSITINLEGTYVLGEMNIMEWKPGESDTRSESTKVEIYNGNEWQTVKEGFSLKGNEFVAVDMGKTAASQIRISFTNNAAAKSACIREITCSSYLENVSDKTEIFKVLQDIPEYDFTGKIQHGPNYEFVKIKKAAENLLNNLNAEPELLAETALNLKKIITDLETAEMRENIFYNKNVDASEPAMSSSYAVEYLADGNLNTRYAGKDTGPEVSFTVDLGERYAIDSVYVEEYVDKGLSRGGETTVQVYDKGEWITIVDKQSLSPQANGWDQTHGSTEFKFDPVKGTKVKIIMVNKQESIPNKRATIYELQAGGVKAPVSNIASVAEPAMIEVPYGTEFSKLTLPETVTAIMEDDTRKEIPVTWGEEDYSPVEEYSTLKGTLITDEDTENPLELDAQIRIHKVRPYIAEAERFDNIEVRVGTPQNALELPTEAKITLSDHTIRTVAVTGWVSDYDGTKPGTYIFYGNLKTGDDYINTQEVKAELQVTVKKHSVEAVDLLEEFQVGYGTDEKKLAQMMPESVMVQYSDGVIKYVPVVWKTESSFDGMKEGTYTFTGEIQVDENYDNASGKKAELKVTVLPKGQSTPQEVEILRQTADVIRKIDLTGYTELSCDAVKEALEAADALITEGQAASEDVEKALRSLQEAVNGLEKEACRHENTESAVLVEATCTQSGCSGIRCTACGDILSTSRIPAKGHQWSDWKTVREATIQQEGLQERVCTREDCDGIKNREEKAINKLPSDPEEPEVPVKGKTYQKGDFIYKVTNASEKNGTVTIIKAVKKNLKKVTIPANVSIQGQTFKVTEIASKAFRSNKNMTTVKIGSNVKKIGSYAFDGAKKLKKITISSKVLKTVGKKAFRNIHAKAKIYVPKSRYKAFQRLLKNKGQKKSVKIVKL